MPIIYQQDINEQTKIAVWKIEEEEEYFLDFVPIHRRITHPKKRLQHLAGRYLLQHLFPDFPYNEIMIADTKRPYLDDNKYHFSISHTKDYAAAIVSSVARVGIDIEMPDDKVMKISHKFMHEEEFGLIQQMNTAMTPEHAYSIIWCAKESMYKWWGLGKVDFKEMLRIDTITQEDNIKLSARFILPEGHQTLELHHKSLNDLCLIWVAS